MPDTHLSEVAAAADQVADEQRQIARRARNMQRQRDLGWSWSKMLDRQPSPGIVELLRRSRRMVSAATVTLTVALAKGLSAEGETRRHIARRLGVTHQRVTALIGGANHDGDTRRS